jgi:cyclophilin family peptidyl-prolyl cis-trans isomerase
MSLIMALAISAMTIAQWGLAAQEEVMKTTNPRVAIETSEGTITIELWASKAPSTVKNFVRYADEGFYDGTIYHRVIDGFMIQGGGFTADMRKKDNHEPIRNEATAELNNERGTIAMARTGDIHSATSQFFINLKDNDFLNHRDNSPAGFGYAVFGKVIQGMDVIDRIGKVKTTTLGSYRDVPATPVVINRVRLVEKEKGS